MKTKPKPLTEAIERLKRDEYRHLKCRWDRGETLTESEYQEFARLRIELGGDAADLFTGKEPQNGRS